jgi:DNA-binding beta-propeller fold protein YncE
VSVARISAWRTFGDPDPDVTRWSHSGIAVLPDERVVYTEPGGGALLFVRDGTVLDRRTVPTADGHGLTASSGADGDVLYVADPGTGNGDGQVLRVDVPTGDVARVVLPETVTDGWRPTSTAVDPAGTLWIADGYGRSLVHAVDADGSVRTLDGSASGRSFDCPHGVVVDTRGAEPRIVVADRSNRRLVVFDIGGAFLRAIEDPLLTSPSSLAVRGEELLVTDLFGALLAVGPDDAVSAVLPIEDPVRDDAWPNVDVGGVLTRPPLRDGVLRSPHGIAVAADGDVLLTEWFLGGRQVRLTLA